MIQHLRFKLKDKTKTVISIGFVVLFIFLEALSLQAQTPDPSSPDRAGWMRGTWGVWLHQKRVSNFEYVFDQIDTLRTLDYVMLRVTGSGVASFNHFVFNQHLVDLNKPEWNSGNNSSATVDMKADGTDPFLENLLIAKRRGLRTIVYTNASAMFQRYNGGGSLDEIPTRIPTLFADWRNYCDANFSEFLAGVVATNPNKHAQYPNKKYMHAYAEFVLKDISKRYGTLIDAWVMDNADNGFVNNAGEDAVNKTNFNALPTYKAYVDAMRAGNPNAAVSFNNVQRSFNKESNPFESTFLDDFTFGHPFFRHGLNGGWLSKTEKRSGASYYRHNRRFPDWVESTNGRVIPANSYAGAANTVAHWIPLQQQLTWNTNASDLAWDDDDFTEWLLRIVQNNGATTYGVNNIHSLRKDPGVTGASLIPIINMAQLTYGDTELKNREKPGAPNWARSHTYIDPIEAGDDFRRELQDGFDFWDPEDPDGNTIVSLTASGDVPSWLTITASADTPGLWILEGTSTDLYRHNYTFELHTNDGNEVGSRTVTITVNGDEEPEPGDIFPDPNKIYHIDALNGRRLAANGESEDGYGTSLTATGADVEWQFVQHQDGYWHIQRAAGGSLPRISTDNTKFPDMQPGANAGQRAQFEVTEKSDGSGYHLTARSGGERSRLLIHLSNGSLLMAGPEKTGTWATFKITEVVPIDIFPDPDKIYHIDALNGRRLAATGESEDGYGTSLTTTGADVEWQFVQHQDGYWHIQRAAGGSLPRISTDNTKFPDMQPGANAGQRAQFEVTEKSDGSGYHLTARSGGEHSRLLIHLDNGSILMGRPEKIGTWATFKITEVVPTQAVAASAVIPSVTLTPMLYPNPTSGIFTIDLGEVAEASYLVYEMNTLTQVASGNFSGQTETVNISGNPSGFYVVTLVVNGQNFSIKVALE